VVLESDGYSVVAIQHRLSTVKYTKCVQVESVGEGRVKQNKIREPLPKEKFDRHQTG
jgi:hypothetical protein